MPMSIPMIIANIPDGIIREKSIKVRPIVMTTFKTPSQRAYVLNFPSLNFCFKSPKNPRFCGGAGAAAADDPVTDPSKPCILPAEENLRFAVTKLDEITVKTLSTKFLSPSQIRASINPFRKVCGLCWKVSFISRTIVCQNSNLFEHYPSPRMQSGTALTNFAGLIRNQYQNFQSTTSITLEGHKVFGGHNLQTLVRTILKPTYAGQSDYKSMAASGKI